MKGLDIDSYLATPRGKSFKKNTVNNFKSAVRILVKYYSEKNINDLSMVTPESLNGFRNFVKDHFKRCLCVLSPLKYLFIWLYEEGLYPYDVKVCFSIRPGIILNEKLVIYQKAMQKAGYTESTAMNKLRALNSFQVFLNDRKINDFSNPADDFALSLTAYMKDKYTKAFARKILYELQVLFRFLFIKKLIYRNPFEKVKRFGVNDYPGEFKDYAEKYLRMKEQEASGNSIRGIKNSLNLFFKYATSNQIKSFNDINKESLKGFVGYLLDLKTKDGKLIYKTVSVNRLLTYITVFLKFLSDEGKIYYGLASSLNKLKGVRSIHRNILTRKELTLLFKVPAGNLYGFMLKTLFICQYSTGLRINELLGLKLQDINFEAKTLLIFESKTNKERFVHIGEIGLRYLDLYLKHAREKINCNAVNMDRVFVSNHEGMGLREGMANKYLKRFCKEAGINKEISTHCFRHSYGTHLLENGAEIKHVSDLLGHEKLTTTEGYTRLSPNILKEVIRKYHPREV